MFKDQIYFKKIFDPIPILLLKKGSSIQSRSSKKDRDPNVWIMDRKILMPYLYDRYF